MNEKFVIVTFYTSKYERFVKPWMDSISEYGIMNIAYPKPDVDNWYLNVANKPRVVLESLDNVGGKDVVWCDVDAILMNEPVLMNSIETDIAGFRVKPIRTTRIYIDIHYFWKNYDVIYTGTVYFKNNDKTRKLCKDWLKYLESDEWLARSISGVPMIGDQDSFNHLIREKDRDLTITELPETYCYIERSSLKVKYPPDTVFLHYVEGSRNSKFVGKRIHNANV